MSDQKKSRAVVTMAKNESVFLPIWWHYYSQFFHPEDIYIIDHDTTDGSTSGPGFVRIPVSHPVVDWGWHRDRLQENQNKLIARYDVVLCTDVDEIVAPDPRTGTLGDYIDRFEGEFVNCRGYEIIHIKNSEKQLNLQQPILEQRFHWYHNPSYSKPLLATVPMQWHGGLHVRVDGKTSVDPSLYLLHLHRVDYDLCHDRHKQRASGPWNQRDVDENWGYQNRIIDDQQFEKWFYEDSCSNTPIEIEMVPDYWRGLI
ncbi:hypothetical protein GS399_01670 [Pedobacter sp. HMF7647]|uniref:Glycosyltransferase family 2 protein n=1 Tax=Hufsiella arboris TaxID=2695275 RepID=A0A7K1Y509_9SPHI|nr:glycosyltransferase family 2 protein [Hufsiella arboris]MXV49664.1 hypothetical protein [Hufsiella arboris]